MTHKISKRLVVGALSAGFVLTSTLLSPLAASAAEGETPGAPERIILNPTADPATSQNITWRAADVPTDTTSVVELRSPDGSVRTVDAPLKEILYIGADNRVTTDSAAAAKTGVTYSATLNELASSTNYAYRVVTGGVASDWYSFTTASATDDPFTLTWYADAQNELTEKWTAMHQLTAQAFPNSEITLQTGDLIDLSVENEWNEWFTITDGERQTENWAVALGNHEYSQDATSAFWTANFTPVSNGPVADPTSAVAAYEELIAQHLDGRVYYTDYQGVRIISLNSQIVSQSNVQADVGTTLPALATADWQKLYLDVQARWLDQVLTDAEGTVNWTVVQFHHAIFSVAQGRDNPLQRAAFLPVVEEHNVDLVLSAHDHTYARGYLDSDVVSDGVTSGPVFAVSNSGPKYYSLATDQTNVWTANGATQVTKYNYISLAAGFRVTPTTLEYEAIVIGNEDATDTNFELGETADSFTITRQADGSKTVTEGVQRRVATGLDGASTEPVAGDIVLEAEIPDLGDGALTLSIADGGTVSLGEAVQSGDRWSFAAALPTITVTDTRAEGAGWSVTGNASDLVGDRGTIASQHLGWSPLVLDAATATAGSIVAGALSGGEGLVGAQLLASADDHSRWGATRLGADVTLEVPIGAQQGQYKGVVNVSLFPVD